VPAISGLPSGELCGIAASMYASRCAFSPVTSTRPGGPGFRRRLSLAILLAHRRAPFDNDAPSARSGWEILDALTQGATGTAWIPAPA
jgi:hypothetical protein